MYFYVVFKNLGKNIIYNQLKSHSNIVEVTVHFTIHQKSLQFVLMFCVLFLLVAHQNNQTVTLQ